MSLQMARYLVRFSMERVALGQFAGLMDDMLKNCLADSSFEEVAGEPLRVRFKIYQALWNETLKTLRVAYLPDSGESPKSWDCPEVTLQTVLYPRRGVVMLLDSDAKRERDNITRIISNHKNVYHLEFIPNGTYEDLFPRVLAIEILNQLYPDGEPIEATDFEEGKSFVNDLKSLLHRKKKATFDKRRFALEIAIKTPVEKIPKPLRDLIDRAHLIAEAHRPLRLTPTDEDVDTSE